MQAHYTHIYPKGYLLTVLPIRRKTLLNPSVYQSINKKNIFLLLII